MKNRHLLLLFAGLLLIVGGCKREVQNPTNVTNEDQVISLTSGAVLSRAANVGIRNQFEAGDQIGVIAFYSTTPADGINFLPRWDTSAYFENKVAAFQSNNTADPILTTFGWGPAAEGGAFNQYYPSGKRKIFLCSYFPYSASGDGSNYVALNKDGADDEARQPKLNVTLAHGPINGGGEGDVLKLQPDILHYMGATTVSSVSPTPSFTYNHALAQVRFTIKRPDGSTPCKFIKLVFKTTAKGVLNLVTGKFAYDAAEADKSNRRDAVYTVELASGVNNSIPEEGPDSTNPVVLDVLNPDKTDKFNYLMVLPLLKPDSELGELTLICDYGVGQVENIRNFNVPLNELKELVAGKLNTLAINVSQYAVSLSASITPWGVGETIELPAE